MRLLLFSLLLASWPLLSIIVCQCVEVTREQINVPFVVQGYEKVEDMVCLKTSLQDVQHTEKILCKFLWPQKAAKNSVETVPPLQTGEYIIKSVCEKQLKKLYKTFCLSFLFLTNTEFIKKTFLHQNGYQNTQLSCNLEE